MVVVVVGKRGKNQYRSVSRTECLTKSLTVIMWRRGGGSSRSDLDDGARHPGWSWFHWLFRPRVIAGGRRPVKLAFSFESSIASQQVSFLDGSTAGGFLSLSCLTSLTSAFFILTYLFYLALLNLTFPYLASSHLSLPYLHRAAWRGWRPLCPRLAPWRRQKENSLMEDTNTNWDWQVPPAPLIFTFSLFDIYPCHVI